MRYGSFLIVDMWILKSVKIIKIILFLEWVESGGGGDVFFFKMCQKSPNNPQPKLDVITSPPEAYKLTYSAKKPIRIS